MNIALWIIQGIVAALFLMAGVTKTMQPREKLIVRMPWVNDFSMPTVRFIGISEFLGGVGLIVPWLTGIATILTPIAAIGLCLTQVLAAAYHFRKKEYVAIAFNSVLFILSAIVAYGRFQG